MKKLYFLFFLIASQQIFSQIKFENGYIVDTQGNRKDLLIRNADWVETPAIIQAKDSESGKEYNLGLKDISEFGFGDGTIYKKFTVDIAHYEEDLSKVDSDPDFTPQSQTVFLKQLSSGKVNLYSHYKGTAKFFYATADQQPKQLLYRKYYNEQNNVVIVATYRDQLSEVLSCPNSNYSQTPYKMRSLKQAFDTYNNGCEKVEAISAGKSRFAVNVVVEGHFISTKTTSSVYYLNNLKMDSKFTPKLGVELEYFLPFNKQSFSIIAAPKYYHYKNEVVKSYDVWPHTQTVKIETSTIEVPIGFRYYNYLDNSSALFITVAYQIKKNLEGTLSLNNQDYDLLNGSTSNVVLGVGYKYNKIMAELVYAPVKGRSSSSISDFSNSGFGLSLKYNVF